LGLTGLQAMFGFYGLMVLTTIGVGCINNSREITQQEKGGQHA
jgi:hypothetical protein